MKTLALALLRAGLVTAEQVRASEKEPEEQRNVVVPLLPRPQIKERPAFTVRAASGVN